MGILNIIGWALFGLVAGAIARFLVPGEQPMGWLATMALGIIGSFVGGLLVALVWGGELVSPTGWIGSVIGAIIALLIYIRLNRRDVTV